MKNNLTAPNEDYLERIYELLAEKGYARVTDIAERLDVKPASVTMMLKKLEQSGHITRESYRGFTLTPKGRSVALGIRKRHQILNEFLHLLNLPQRIIDKDIEGLEHYLSNETLVQLEHFVHRLKKNT